MGRGACGQPPKRAWRRCQPVRARRRPAGMELLLRHVCFRSLGCAQAPWPAQAAVQSEAWKEGACLPARPAPCRGTDGPGWQMRFGPSAGVPSQVPCRQGLHHSLPIRRHAQRRASHLPYPAKRGKPPCPFPANVAAAGRAFTLPAAGKAPFAGLARRAGSRRYLQREHWLL